MNLKFRLTISRLKGNAILSKDSLEVIYQTRETVCHRDIQTPRRELKIRRTAEPDF